MNLKEILDTVNYRVNKEQSGNTLSPEEFNIVLKNVNIEMFKKKLGLPEEYQIGNPVPRQAYELTKVLRDDLRHLKYVMGVDGPALKIDSNGVALIPSDYFYSSSLRYIDTSCESSTYRDIEEIRDDHWGERLSDALKKPTHKYPCCLFQRDTIVFEPKDLSVVEFTYLRVPKTPEFKYTIVDDEVVYNSTTSVQLDWPDRLHSDFVAMIISYVADNLREQFLKQSSEQRKNQGF